MKSMTAINARRKQAGFTIIELVVVILLLGILTATALPRFMDVTDEAHNAVVDAVTGGFTTGVALFRAQWVGEGQPLSSVTDSPGFNLYASTTGYPRSATLTNSTVATATSTNVCLDIYNSILQAGGRPGITVATGLAADSAATRETAVESAASSATTADFVAVLDRDNATPTVATNTCKYYYVGQNRAGTSTATVSIPVISYNYVTGVTSRLTNVTFDQD